MSDEKKVTRGHPRLNGVTIGVAKETLKTWAMMELACTSHGNPYANCANMMRILTGHPDLVGYVWYDEFHDRVYSTLWSDEPAEWADDHDVALMTWVQDELRIPAMLKSTVRDALDRYARLHVRNEPRDWLNSLKWDGTDRLERFMSDAFGASQNDYTAAAGRCWLTSMVARIYTPGAKVDYMPVFEGWQGLSKSSALDALGGKWFAETHEDITKKDFLQNLQGKMLVEFSELHAFKRAEIERIKGIITCRVDRYRQSYGRHATDKPRQCVFAGTTNRDDWVQDDTGARRFWPISCGDISVEYIRINRDQLFAEAVSRFKAGQSWWDIDSTLAKQEQDARREQDVWADYILPWAARLQFVNVSDALAGPLDISPDRQGRSEQMRVASILKLAGYRKIEKWVDGKNKKVWLPPSQDKKVERGGEDELGF